MRSEKLIEARPCEKKYENLPDGGLIKWHWYKKERLVTRLVRKTKFNSINEMLTSVGDIYKGLGAKYQGPVIALELTPVQWLENVEPKYPRKTKNRTVMRKPSKKVM
eukprot:s876_g10.t1